MSVAIGIFIAAAMIVTLCVSLITNIKLWELTRDSRRSFRQLPAPRRRRIHVMVTATYAIVIAYLAVVLAAPFGTRDTLLYLVILPVVVLGPLMLLAVGVRGFRGQRHRRPPSR